MDDKIIWEIDRLGRLSVEKIDGDGSGGMKIWLGPFTEVLATLADFLNRSTLRPKDAPNIQGRGSNDPQS